MLYSHFELEIKASKCIFNLVQNLTGSRREYPESIYSFNQEVLLHVAFLQKSGLPFFHTHNYSKAQYANTRKPGDVQRKQNQR